MGLATHRLIQSCKTRRNSVCEMFGGTAVGCSCCPIRPNSDQASRCQDPEVEGGVLEADGGHTACDGSTEVCYHVYVCREDVSICNTYPVSFSFINLHLMRQEGDGPRVIEFKTKVRSSLINLMNVS